MRPGRLCGVVLQMTGLDHAAREGEEIRFRDGRGQDWTASWHPPEFPAPAGKPHGSAGICFTPVGNIVLVTRPGISWEFPAGRPDGDENWRTTLDREVMEEACAVVEDATLLGFVRIACIKGPEEGLVLIRSLWCADVSLDPWEPRHETTARMIAPPDEALERVGFGGDHRPIFERWFRDALAAKGLA